MLETKKSFQGSYKLKEIKNMNKNLKEDLSKIFTYHIDRWYNNEGNNEVNNEVNEEDINFKRVKTNLSNKADVYNKRNNQRNIT